MDATGKQMQMANALRTTHTDKGKYGNATTYYGNNTKDGIHTTHWKPGKKYGGSNVGGGSIGGAAG